MILLSSKLAQILRLQPRGRGRGPPRTRWKGTVAVAPSEASPSHQVTETKAGPKSWLSEFSKRKKHRNPKTEKWLCR